MRVHPLQISRCVSLGLALGIFLYACLLVFLFTKRAATLIPQKHLHLIQNILFFLCAAGIVFYMGVFSFLLIYKNDILYHQEKVSVEDSNIRNEKNGILPWKNALGETIGWIISPQNEHAKFRVIIFHGQGGTAYSLLYFSNILKNQTSQGSWEIYLFEYPGYGTRAGKPSEKTIVSGVIEAFDELKKADDRPIFIMGQSLGCAVTCQVVAHRAKSVAGIVLMSPFYNLGSTAQYQFPIFPVSLLLWNDYRSDLALKSYTGPAAFIVDGADTTIPPEFALQLYQEYQGPKLLKFVPHGYHCEIPEINDPWWKEMNDFILAKQVQP